MNRALVVAVLWAFGAGFGLAFIALPKILFLVLAVTTPLLLAGILRLEYLFYLFILTFAVEYANIYFDIGKTRYIFFPFNFLSVFIAFGYLVARATGRIEKRVSTPADKILLLIVAYQLVSILWVPDYGIAFYLALMLVFNYFVFIVSGAVIRDEASLRRIVNVWIFAGVLIGTGIMVSQWWQYHTIVKLTRNISSYIGFILTASRPAGVGYVDVVAGFDVSAFFLALGSAFYSREGWKKVLFSVITMYLLYCVVLTTSRGAFISIIAGLMFFVMINPFTKGRFLKYMVLFSLLSVFVVLLAKPGFIDRILIGFGYNGTLLFSDISYSASSAAASGVSGMDQRTEWWTKGLNTMFKEPLTLIFGLGLGGFFYHVKNLEHSIPLAFFYEMGAMGVVFYIILFTIMAVNIYNAVRKPSSTYSHQMLLASSTALVAIVVVNGLIYFDLVSRFFWFPLGFVTAVLNLAKRESGT